MLGWTTQTPDWTLHPSFFAILHQDITSIYNSGDLKSFVLHLVGRLMTCQVCCAVYMKKLFSYEATNSGWFHMEGIISFLVPLQLISPSFQALLIHLPKDSQDFSIFSLCLLSSLYLSLKSLFLSISVHLLFPFHSNTLSHSKGFFYFAVCLSFLSLFPLLCETSLH